MLKAIDPATPASFNGRKWLYLLLTVIGAIAPWVWLLQDVAAILSPALFVQRAFTNPVTTALATDLLVSVVVFFSFVWFELKRLNLSRTWLLLYVGLTFGIGLSCALPFFLYRRELALERQGS